METLRLMVKSILVIIMLAACLEIVLPRSDMKRYVNLVIGLFVILAILNPMLSLVHKGLDLDVFDNAAGQSQETNSLIEKGKKMALEERSRAAGQYKDKLSKQIMGIAGLYQSAKATGVDVEIIDDPASENFGQIKKITIHTSAKNTGGGVDNSSRTVEGVEVNVNEINVDNGKNQKKNANGQEQNLGLRNIIADFYGLEPEQIRIDK